MQYFDCEVCKSDGEIVALVNGGMQTRFAPSGNGKLFANVLWCRNCGTVHMEVSSVGRQEEWYLVGEKESAKTIDEARKMWLSRKGNNDRGRSKN